MVSWRRPRSSLVAVRNQHVVRRGNKWAVRKSGAEKVTRRFDTQREAVEAARDLARNQRCAVYIHDQYGGIAERESYGGDTVPSRG